MSFVSTDLTLAQELDAQDPLAHFREQFVISDPNVIYMDGNSLGRLPRETVNYLHEVVEKQWGDRLIRSWNENWIVAPLRAGAKIARLIGAQPDEVLVCDSTSVNLYKLVMAALNALPDRTRIISDVFNFPSDLYIMQGIIETLGNKHKLILIPSIDGISISLKEVEELIDEKTALVCLTHVAFKSATMYDMAYITRMAHEAGALMLWDLSHSVGAIPLELNKCNVDLAVGCTYKHLNGGPGSPAFLYVRKDLHEKMQSPIWGWFAAKQPFDFDLEFTPAEDISRFRTGTPPILSLKALGPALDLILEAGIQQIRGKSIMQTEYLIYLVDQWLLPFGFTLGSPRDPKMRGSHISVRHPQAYRINRALIESRPPAVKVIPDFRAPDNIRLASAPLYTSFSDINQAMQRIKTVVESGIYKDYPSDRLSVT